MTCGFRRREALPKDCRLRILLTNGRFPVSLDLARQLHRAGHTVFCVDPMRFHVCAFSVAVKESHTVPAPHDDAKGYVNGVVEAVRKWKIDQIIPVHEEIFFLAESGEREILDRLFAPAFELLVTLHNKWEFTKMMKRMDMDVPKAHLCKNYADVENLSLDKYEHGLALKPCFGRASIGVYHLQAGEPLPKPENLDVGHHNHYIAQEWIKGDRYCAYAVVRDGKPEAIGLYPTFDTVDGSSSVFFRQQYHAGIYAYIERFCQRCTEIHGPFTGQIAFDFVEDVASKRIMTINCNPRATSALHLWTGSPDLAYAMTNTLPDEIAADRPIQPPTTPFRSAHVQGSAGLLIWEHQDDTISAWAKHMAHLMGTRDVVWCWRDLMPTMAQPFLLTEYYRICRQTGLQLPDLLESQVSWEPKGEQLKAVRRMIVEQNEQDDRKLRERQHGLLEEQKTRETDAGTWAEQTDVAVANAFRFSEPQDSPTLGRKEQPIVPLLRDSVLSESSQMDKLSTASHLEAGI
ncbi:hypothetical protein LTR36_003485 [Oleoguttula mirabilis]|uniref:ATP-grasp domain-containing protein n=1 Tax=Oleoguttula mirabilis TaxID=1507867 RepID=A0AAV9JJ64_9PEZI|nr:hypothetical protein LTR36_003485 [Oleoguttula mirabilis]